MKTENEDILRLDDLIFENRNKVYGAYVIRKLYADNLNRAMLFVLSSVVTIIILQHTVPSVGIVRPPTSYKEKIILGDPPPFRLEKAKQKIVTSLRKAIRNLPPVVTNNPDPVVESPIQEAAAGSDEGVEIEGTPAFGVEGVAVDRVVPPVVEEAPKVLDRAEVMPQYEGGMEAMMKFLRNKIRYPAIARRLGTQGSVFVSFVINTDGSIIQAKVIKGISKECDEEALRVISMMPAWRAGRQGNVPVMVRMVLPIKFQLN
jgi:protein TonB